MPSLSEMRARKGAAVARPRSTHTVTLVTGQHLLDEQKRLNDDLVDELAKAARPAVSDEDGDAKPRKMSERTTTERVTEIRAGLLALRDQLAGHQGQLTLVGNLSDGDWLRWKEEHPAREDNADDTRVGGGFVNTTDLYLNLGAFVAEWDGEPVADGDWDAWLADQITFADKAAMVTEVVELYEARLSRAPKSQGSLSETPDGLLD